MTRTPSIIKDLLPGSKFYFTGKSSIEVYSVIKIEQKGKFLSIWHDKSPHALVEKLEKKIIIIT